MPVTAEFVIDFAALADVSPYTDPDILQVGAGSVKVASGALAPVASGAARRLMYSGTVANRVRALVDLGTTASFDYVTPGIFNDDGSGFIWRPSAGKLFINKINTGTTTSSLTDIDNGVTFSPTDVLELDYDADTNMLRGYKNGVWVLGKTADTYSGVMRPGVLVRWGDAGTATATSIGFNGITVAAPAAITDVNGGSAVTQYQQGVAVTYADFDPATITAITLNGLACTFDALGAFNVPGSLASGTYELAVTHPGGVITANVPYTRTHPIQVPAAGTATHLESVFAQMGNPGGRYCSVTKPALLEWKAPYASFTADNLLLPVSDLFTAPHDALDGATYEITGSVLDADGSINAFSMSATIDDGVVEPPDPDPEPEPTDWTVGRRHPKTQAMARMWLKDRE